MKKRRFSVFTVVTCVILALCVLFSGCGMVNDITDSIQSITLTDESGVAVSGKLEEGSVLVVEKVTGAKKQEAVACIADEDYYKDGEVYVFDISVVKDNAKVQPSGKIKISIPATGLDSSKTYKVFHVKDDGTVESLSATISSSKLEFETSSFSYFIIAEEDTRAKVQVSINILPLAEYGTLKVNGELLTAAASYKTTHLEGDTITVEAVAAEGHHFIHWLSEDDTVLSEQSEYTFTVAKNAISFGAIFTEGHVVEYTDVNEDTHTESCKYCDHSETVAHEFVNEEIISEATCKQTGEKKLTCACGKVKYETIPVTDHNYVDGVCTVCGKVQLYVRCQSTGVADPNGDYIKMGKTYCEKVTDDVIIDALTNIAGSPYMTNYENWTPFDFGNGDSGEDATTYYCDVEYNGLHYRGVNIKDYRKDNDGTQTSSSRYWTGTYWFEQRNAMWKIVKEEDGIAYLVSKEIWISQRFAESDEGELTYEKSWIRNWLTTTWINELFTPEQQAILRGNEACFGDKIFLPSSSEISINNPKPFSYYAYPLCLGAYKEVLSGYGDNYCPYWLRDEIVKGDDGKNYVTCVTSRPPFDQTVQYLATKTFVGVVPAVYIDLTV
ncbi:MAG: DUF6273 domain-containing protein [Candidatus Coproplasma sp.]